MCIRALGLTLSRQDAKFTVKVCSQEARRDARFAHRLVIRD